MNSINSKKRGNRKTAAICYGISAAVFLLIYFWGEFWLCPGDELGYSLLSFYLIMPLTAFIISAVLSAKNCVFLWLYPVVFGILGFLIPFAVFVSLGPIMFCLALIPSLLGILAGSVFRKTKTAMKKKHAADRK